MPKTEERRGEDTIGKIRRAETELAPAMQSKGKTIRLRTGSFAPVICRSLPAESATFIVSVI